MHDASPPLPTVARIYDRATWPAYVSPTQTGAQNVKLARAFLEHQHGTVYDVNQAGNAIMSAFGVRVCGYYICDAFSAMVSAGTAQIWKEEGDRIVYLIP